MRLQTIILAAGKGTRMNSDIPKPLIPVNGEPMLTHVLRAVHDSEVETSPILVVGSWTVAIQEHYGDIYNYAIQTKINGTGGAVRTALPFLDTSETAPPVLILYADHPFITSQSIDKLAKLSAESQAVLTIGTVTVEDYSDWRAPFNSFGRVVRDGNGEVKRIIEYKNASESERQITEVNPALYCVSAIWLAKALEQIKPNELTGEYYITDLVELAVSDGYKIETTSLAPAEALGLNSLEDIENAKNAK